MVNGRYCERIEDLILSPGRDCRLREPLSRFYLRLVNNIIQLGMYRPFRNNLQEKDVIWGVGVLYVPCFESIAAVLLSNQEGFDLVKRSRIGVGKVDLDEIFEGCA